MTPRRTLAPLRRPRVWRLLAICLFACAVSFLMSEQSATAAEGDIVRTFEAQVPSCGIGVGIAFDGSKLLVSCYYTNVLSAVSPSDGSFIADYPITGVGGIGALAFDRAGNRVWLCEAGSDRVYTADLLSGASQYRFQSNGCFDGLSYDPSDNTVWASPDASTPVTHYATDGTIIGTIDISGQLGGCGNSGIAVGQSELFLSNDGCSEIYRMTKTGASVSKVGEYPARLEDLECDDTTFPGQTVIWSKDAYDPVLNAFNVGAIDCGVNSYRDSDGDGISDTWELDGADVDGDGTVDLDLPAMGADPLHKDLFVEIDWLTKDPRKIGPISLGGGFAYPPSIAATSKVVNAFNSWPVPNPDGHQGIHLHLDAGVGSVMNPVTGAKWGSRSRANAIRNGKRVPDWSGWGDLDTLRSSNVDSARRGIFHYVLYVDDGCGSNCTGFSRGIPGHDLYLVRGHINTDLQEAVTLAHELGHNLGLGHGGRARTDDPGSQHVNEKANYLSIMNYLYSNTGLMANNGVDGIIQFSSREHDALYPTDLAEVDGLNPDPYGHLRVKYRCRRLLGIPWVVSADSWSSVDWNCDGSIANGSSNPYVQSPDDVTANHADANRVLGSEDYHSLYFWGTGSAWDARNEAIQDFDQPGTAEPSIEQAKTDGVWWPARSLLTDSDVELTVYSDSGTATIPLSLENPGTESFAITPQLTPGDGFVLPVTGELELPAGGSVALAVELDTAGLSSGVDVSTTVNYLDVDSDVLGSTHITAHVAAVSDPTPDACEQARDARAAPDLPPEQAPALDAFLEKCDGAGGAPIARDDSVITDEDVNATVSPLGNDSDPEGTPLTIQANSDVSHGTVTCGSSTCTYEPVADFNGADEFSYTVVDGEGLTSQAIVHITVTAINDRPVARDDAVRTTASSAPFVLDVLTNDSDVDGDSLAVVGGVLNGPGVLELTAGQLRYTPPSTMAVATSASVRYTISDGHGGEAMAGVTISVDPAQPTTSFSVQNFYLVRGRLLLMGGSLSDQDVDSWCGRSVVVTVGTVRLAGRTGPAKHGRCTGALENGSGTGWMTLDVEDNYWSVVVRLRKPIGFGILPFARERVTIQTALATLSDYVNLVRYGSVWLLRPHS